MAEPIDPSFFCQNRFFARLEYRVVRNGQRVIGGVTQIGFQGMYGVKTMHLHISIISSSDGAETNSLDPTGFFGTKNMSYINGWTGGFPLNQESCIIKSAQNGDQYEPDDNFTQATSISTDGSRQTHSIHRAGDADWVKFSATSGQRYVIETSNLRGDADTYIGLFWDNDGHPWLIEENDDGDSGLASRIEWIALSSGTFYVKIRDYQDNHGGPNVAYDIQITVNGQGQASGNTQGNRSGTVINSDRLNVRAGPGTGYAALGQLTRNQNVEILARNANSSWYQISFSAGPDGFGWVYFNYIQTSASGLPVSDQTSSALATSSQAPIAAPAAPAAPSQQTQTVGNMNMGRYCQERGFDEAALSEQTAYGWHCRSGDGRTSGMNLEELCQQQHGSGYKPEYSNFNDPYSWQCISTGSAPAPSQLSQPSQPAPQPQSPQPQLVTRYSVDNSDGCGLDGIIRMDLRPVRDSRLLEMTLTKCDGGRFVKNGYYYIAVDGAGDVRYGAYAYDNTSYSFTQYIDPVGDNITGYHTYWIQLFPDGQSSPITSNLQRAGDVQVSQ